MLPTEIFANICSNFCRHCRGRPGSEDEVWQVEWDGESIRTLYSLSLVSRRLRDTAQPILYHEFTSGTLSPATFEHFTVEPVISDVERRIIPFLRTLVRRPDLAAHVRTCYIGGRVLTMPYYSRPVPRPYRALQDLADEKDPDHDRISAATTAVLEEAAAVRGVNLSQLLQRCGEDGDDDRPFTALLAMLLASLPNVSWLYLACATTNMRFFPAAALDRAGAATLPIRTLNVLRAHEDLSRGPEGDGPLSSLLGVMSETLRELNIKEAYGYDLLGGLERPLTQLKSFSFRDGTQSSRGLDRFLSCCGSLESFEFCGLLGDTSHRNLGSTQGGRDYTYDIARSLDRFKDTLRVLRFATELHGSSDRLSSLRDFRVLEELSIDGRLLGSFRRGSEIADGEIIRLLPPSLTSLNLRLGYGSMIGGFLEVLGHDDDDSRTTDFADWALAKCLAQVAAAARLGQLPLLRRVSCHLLTPVRLQEVLEVDMNLGRCGGQVFAGSGVEFNYVEEVHEY